MYKVSNKSIAAFAVLMMVFAGFGVAFGAGADDAAKTGRIGGSIVVEDSLEIGYANVDDDLYMAVTADLDLSGCTTVPEDGKSFFTYHLGNFITAVGAFFDEATMTFVISYEIKDGTKTTTIADIVPASFLVYFTEDTFTISAEKASDLAVLKAIETNYTTAAAGADVPYIAFEKTDIDFSAVSLAAADVSAYSAEEIIDIIAEAIAPYADYLSPEEVEKAVNAAKQAVIDQYKDYKSPEEVKKAIDDAVAEATKNVKKGDSTIAWCVAAVGIIAAVVLAGFVIIVYRKAAKEGRRLL